MVPMALHPMSGEQWLTSLIDGLEEQKGDNRSADSITPLVDELDKALLSLLLSYYSTTPAAPMPIAKQNELEVLASVLDARQGHVPADQVASALLAFISIQTVSDRTVSSLARVVAQALLDGTTSGNGRGSGTTSGKMLDYRDEFRAFSAHPSARQWLGAAYLLLDHQWALLQLPKWMGADRGSDRDLLLSNMLGTLTSGELAALRTELLLPPPATGATGADGATVFDPSLPLPHPHPHPRLCAEIERISRLPFVLVRGASVRW